MIKKILITTWLVVVFFIPNTSQAADPLLTLGPGKIEVELIPGGQISKDIFIVNNLGRESVFDISFEDVEASPAEEGGVRFLGRLSSQFSLKNYFSVPEQSFVLAEGEEKIIPVTITLPDQAPVGSLHAVVLVTPRLETVTASPQTKPRLGLLVFVKVAGEKQESGFLASLNQGRYVNFGSQAIKFSMLFNNNGNTYLNPYGLLSIKPLFGGQSKEIVIKPWFVLPQSTRQKIVLAPELKTGIYQAELQLNRGYENIIDKKTVWFIVLGWLTGLIIGGLIILLIGGLIYRFMIKLKT